MKTFLLKIFWSGLLLICSILAIISAIVPILPMTPWLVASAVCLTKIVPAFDVKWQQIKLQIKNKIRKTDIDDA